jgi:hypothetical protein
MKIIKSIESIKMFELKESILFLGDAKEVLSIIPNKTVQCTVCSPPYWERWRKTCFDRQLSFAS